MSNVMRRQYRQLTEAELGLMNRIKDLAEDLHEELGTISRADGGTREVALAKTKLEEAVMWAVKAITG